MAERAGLVNARQGVVSTSPSFLFRMTLPIDRYRTMTAPELCADPFFQEWVFYPLSADAKFWLDLLIDHSHISMPLQIAQSKLLQYSRECPLIAKAIEQYMLMKTALHKTSGVEDCFSITMEHWNCIRGELITYEFDCNKHEIQFFKVIKPLFGGEKEYFFLRHHADLFGGADSKFWERQWLRMERFVAENAVFALAYTTGNTRHDEWWYCRAEHRDETSHDGLVAAYGAVPALR